MNGWLLTVAILGWATAGAMAAMVIAERRKKGGAVRPQPITKDEVEAQIKKTSQEIAAMSTQQLVDFTNDLLRKRSTP